MTQDRLVPLQPRAKTLSAASPDVTAGYSLRVSLLEQCQLSCGYCMPGAVQPFTPRDRWLSPSHYARLAPHFAGLGVYKIHFTGGEPLLRPEVAEIVAVWRDAMPAADLALTTNGLRLLGQQEALQRAGLDRVTVHLDTLRPERYRALMGPGRVEDVLAAVEGAKSVFRCVKVNVVVQRGLNDDELSDFLAWSAHCGVEVRFIELMNTGSAGAHVADRFIAGAEIIEQIRQVDDVLDIPRRSPEDPARMFQLRSGTVFGLIASDSQPFCDRCNRIRLTAEGGIRGCLYAAPHAWLRPGFLESATEAEIRTALEQALRGKRSHHPASHTERVPFSMADVGG